MSGLCTVESWKLFAAALIQCMGGLVKYKVVAFLILLKIYM